MQIMHSPLLLHFSKSRDKRGGNMSNSRVGHFPRKHGNYLKGE